MGERRSIFIPSVMSPPSQLSPLELLTVFHLSNLYRRWYCTSKVCYWPKWKMSYGTRNEYSWKQKKLVSSWMGGAREGEMDDLLIICVVVCVFWCSTMDTINTCCLLCIQLNHYVELGYLEHSAILNCFSPPPPPPPPPPPLSSNQLRLSRTLLRFKETLVNISQEVQSRHLPTRCTESWEMYWCVHKSKLLDWLNFSKFRRWQVAGIWGSNYLANLTILNPHYLKKIFDSLESSTVSNGVKHQP